MVIARRERLVERHPGRSMSEKRSASAPALRQEAVVARLLAGGLLISGWVVLGALGQRYTPLRAGGLLPLAIWLAAAGGCARVVARWPINPRACVATALGAAVATAWSLLAVTGTAGGGAALCVAAASWGVLLGVLLMRSGRSNAEALRHADVAPSLATLLLECAVPRSMPSDWRAPPAWGLLAARWGMLPMMATLAAMPAWCSGAAGGLTSAGWVTLHLAAMLLPGLTLAGLRVRLGSAHWVASALLGSGIALLCLPGWRGLMVASLAQAVAWGLGSVTRRPVVSARTSPSSFPSVSVSPSPSSFPSVSVSPSPSPSPSVSVSPSSTGSPDRTSLWSAGCPALLVLALGMALAAHGPAALGAVQAALSLLGAASLVAGGGRCRGLLGGAAVRSRAAASRDASARGVQSIGCTSAPWAALSLCVRPSSAARSAVPARPR